MSDLKCSGTEWTLEECSWTAPSEECLTHAHDAIVFCSNGNIQGESQGQVRLIAQDGSPAIEGQGRPEVLVHGSWSPVCSTGLSSGSPAVLCKAMGFSGVVGSARCQGEECGSIAQNLAELACSGSEGEPLACPHESGDDVFCAPSESVVITCAGDGDAQGRLTKETAPQAA